MKKFKFLICIWLFVLIFFPSAKVFAFEDIRYDISAQFNPEEKSIRAHETVTFKNNSGQSLGEIYFRVYPNHKYSGEEKKELYEYATYFKVNPYPNGFDPGAFQIKAIQMTQPRPEALSYAFEGDDQTLMRVALPQPLGNGESITMEIEFSLKIPHRIGRYGWHKNTFALNRWYPLLGVFDKTGWHKDPDYLLHMPYMSEAAFYRFKLNVPEDFIVALGCDEVNEERMSDGRKLISASSSQPLRELTLALSKDYHVYELQENGIKIQSFYFQKDKEYGRKAAEFAADLIRFYSKHFGSYPYKQFSIAPVYLGYGGSQNAGIIFIDLRAYEMPKFLIRYFDFLISHETGHQWWYSMVGTDEYRQVWLDEGFNTYWTQRYLENKYGTDAKIVVMPRWLEYFIPDPTFRRIRDYQYLYFARRGLDQSIVTELPSFYEPSLIFTMAYGKGSAVVRMFAAYVGEEKFSKIMRTYFQRYQYQNATIGDFIKVCEEVTGEDLKWFFDEWLYGTGLCDYALRRQKGKLVLEKLGRVTMPVETKLEFQDGTQEIISSSGKERSETIDIPKDKKLKSASLDYEEKLLDIDRVNNHLPRKLDVKFVPIYLWLYDYPLFLKEDAYNWVTGPSFSAYGLGLRTSFQKPDDYIVYAASHYQLNSSAVNSSVGFEKMGFLHQYMSWGAEFFNRDSKNDEEDDLRWYKLYIRRELSLGEGFFEPASHLTFYLLHNWSLGNSGFLGSAEDAKSLRYRQKQETIFGVAFYDSHAGSLPDPSTGYKLVATGEVAGHILNGSDAFSRVVLEFDKYIGLFDDHKLAIRLKGAGGIPKNKYLFYLGSDTELRGYDFKDIKGSSMLLASFEYRFPLIKDIDARLPYNIFNLDKVQGVLFFDTGSAWFNEFNEPGFKKDVGFGLRFYFNIAGAAEKFALRLDIAYPLSSEEKDTHVWVGINQAF